MLKRKKTALIKKECVACGTCEKVCPLKAISIYNGITAVVDTNRCVGCGKCSKACPANVINMKEVNSDEKTMV